MNYRILIVDDDKALLEMLSKYFSRKGYDIYTAGNGLQALDQLTVRPDLILLDINMPVMNGLEVCQQIRGQVSCPILFLTAKVEEEDRVNGLLSGGDDYIVKPFSLKELDARLTAHLKREERHLKKTDLRFFGGMIIDYAGKNITIDNHAIEFTAAEYAIVEYLSMHPGQVFDREKIYEKVMGFDGEGDSRGITELIRRIRGKLAKYSDHEFIETVWGNGYRWKK